MGYAGNDITSLQVTGTAQAMIDTCCTTCSTTPGCVGWTVNAGVCWIKSKMVESGANTNVVAAGTYTSPYTSATCSTIQKGMDYAGNDIKNVAVSGTEQQQVDACCKACANQISCVGWAINSGKCWLKNKMILSGANSIVIAGYYEQPTISSGKCGSLVQDVDYSGNDIKNFAVTGSPQDQTDQCCSACSTTSGCVGFVTHDNTCWLKNKMTKSGALVGTIAGTYTAPYTSKQCSIISSGMGYAGNDITSLQVTGTAQAMIDTCCTTCSTTPGCVGWTVNAGVCWIKSKMVESGANTNVVAAGTYTSPY
ncbi:hypothetical protein ACHHYP_05869, partial [Achlya hypogyna]